jgi:hypothetical protein
MWVGSKAPFGRSACRFRLTPEADSLKATLDFALGPIDEACEFAIDPALTFYYDPFSFFERPSHQVFALYKMTQKHLRETQGD